MENRADAGNISGIRATVSAVSNGKVQGLRAVRLHLGELVRAVWNGSVDEDHRPGVKEAG